MLRSMFLSVSTALILTAAPTPKIHSNRDARADDNSLPAASAYPSAPPTDFGSVNVGQALTQTITFSVTNAIILGPAPRVLTLGSPNLDYTLASNTCSGSLSAASTCTVSVQFAPWYSGPRAGALQFLDNAGTVLFNSFLSGIGVAPQVAYGPGVQSVFATGVGPAAGLVVDAAGNVFVAAGTSIFKCASGAVPVKVAGNLILASSLALDGAGDLFIADSGAGAIYELPSGGGTQITLLNGLSGPSALAVDAASALFFSTNAGIYKLVPSATLPALVVPASSFPVFNPVGIAIDAAGNIFIAEGQSVYEWLASSGQLITPFTPGDHEITGIAVDAADDVFLSDAPQGLIRKIAADGTRTIIQANGVAYGVAVDATGNVFYTVDDQPHSLYEVNLSQPPSLTFPQTYVGSQSSTQSLSIVNIGNAQLAPSGVTVSPNFQQIFNPGGPTDCYPVSPTNPGDSCNLSIAFVPTTSGPLTGTATVFNTNLNGRPATEVIPLSGIGLIGPVNVTASFSVTSGALVYNRVTRMGTETLIIHNLSSATIIGPVEVVLAISNPAVTPNGNAGLYYGNPYWTVSSHSLIPNDSLSITVSFSYPVGTSFTTIPTIYSGGLH